MGILKLLARIITRFFTHFLQGEKIADFTSMCYLDYANYYLHDERKVDESIKYFNKSLSLNPDNPYSNGGLALALIIKQRHRHALDYCNKAISIKPNLMYYDLQFIIYRSLGDVELSEKSLKKIRGFFNDDLSAVYDHIAFRYSQCVMYKESENFLRKAIEINSDEVGLHFNLALILEAQKQSHMAKEEFQKVLTMPVKKSDKKYKRYAKRKIEEG